METKKRRYAVTDDGHEFHLPKFYTWEEADKARAYQAAGTLQFAAQGSSHYKIWDYATTPPTDVTHTPPTEQPQWWSWDGRRWLEGDPRQGVRASRYTCTVWGTRKDRDRKRNALLRAVKEASRPLKKDQQRHAMLINQP